MKMPQVETISLSKTMFTTDPSSTVDNFKDLVDKAATTGSGGVQGAIDGVTGGVQSAMDNTIGNTAEAISDKLSATKSMLPPVVQAFIPERCENVPDFDIRFDISMPGLSLNLPDLPCGLDEKIKELLDLDEMKEELGGKLLDFIPSGKGKDAILKIIPGIDPMEVKPQQEAVAAFTNSVKVTTVPDNSMATATAGGLLRQSTRMGLHENIAILFDESPSHIDRGKMHTYLLGSMRRAIDAGHLDTINECVKITGGPALLTVYPDAVEAILEGYRIPSWVTQDDYLEEAERLIACLDGIDSSWDKYESLPTYSSDTGLVESYKCSVNSLKPFMRVGHDAKRLLGLHARTQISIALIDTVELMSIHSAVKLAYPEAAL